MFRKKNKSANVIGGHDEPRTRRNHQDFKGPNETSSPRVQTVRRKRGWRLRSEDKTWDLN